MTYNPSKLTAKKGGLKNLKKALKGQVKAVKKGTKVDNVKKPKAPAQKAIRAKSQNGTKNAQAVTPKAKTDRTVKKTFDWTDYFQNDGSNPLGGFKGFTDKKGY